MLLIKFYKGITMFKHKFTKEKQIKDYEKTVELFNKTNTIKIGDNVNLVLQLFDNDMNITSSELIEVTVDLALYGVAEDEYKDFSYFCFEPVFIIGDPNNMPEPGEEYAKKIYHANFEITPVEYKLPTKGVMRFGKAKYQIVHPQM